MNDDTRKTDASLSKIVSKQERKHNSNINMTPIFHDDDTAVRIIYETKNITYTLKKIIIFLNDYDKMYVEELYLYGTQQSRQKSMVYASWTRR